MINLIYGAYILRSDVGHVGPIVNQLRAWVSPDMLKLLGEVEGEATRFHPCLLHWDLNSRFTELDQEMLATNSKRQKWKSAAIRAECRHSYK